MSVDDFPSWVYTFLIAPILLTAQRIYSHHGRITKVEERQDLYEKKVDKMCKSNEDLTKKVHEMIGKLDEHLK